MKEVVFSNDVRYLFSAMLETVQKLPLSLCRATIVFPDGALHSWFTHECAQNSFSILSLELYSLEEFLDKQPGYVSPRSFLPILSGYFKDFSLVKKMVTPCMMRAFFGETKWFSTPEREKLWKKVGGEFKGLCAPIEHDTPLFFFGFSSLNRFLFERCAACPNFFALFSLSPCMLYWGDHCSDAETRKLLERAKTSSTISQGQLEQLILNRNRFLANTGQVGKEFLLMIEQTISQSHSLYVIPKAIYKPPYNEYGVDLIMTDTSPRLIDYVKADLLFLIGKREEILNINRDISFEVHATYTPLREVEALSTRLSKEPVLDASSVLILVTDISKYAAAIEQVFGREKGPLYQIWGEPEQSGAISAFRMLMALLQSKGNMDGWIRILRHPFFQKMLSLDNDEIQALISWLSLYPQAWGINKEYCTRYCQERVLPEGQTRSLEELYQEYSTGFVQGGEGEWEEKIECSTAHGFGIFFSFIQSINLLCDLPFYSKQLLSMEHWRRVYEGILSWCILGRGGYEDEALSYALGELVKISQTKPESVVPFYEVQKLMDALIEKALCARSANMKTPIIVAVFGKIQPFPVKVLGLLGFQEEYFPRYDHDRMKDSLHKMVSGTRATNIGVDQYAFIEAILSAENLFIGYQASSSDSGHGLSPVVGDLMFHLDENYRIDGSKPSDTLCIQHALQRPSQEIVKTTKSKETYIEKKPIEHNIIDLKDFRMAPVAILERFFKKNYLCSHFSHYQDPLFIQPWKAKDFLLGKKEMPSSGQQHVLSLHHEFEKRCRKFPDSTFQLSTLHCLPTVTKSIRDERHVFCPPLQFTGGEIVGSWPDFSLDAVVLYSEFWQQELFYRWSEIIVRDTLKVDVGKNIYILSEGKNIQVSLTSPQDTLQAWCEFYHLSETTPFPFTYEIVQLLVQEAPFAEVFDCIQTHIAKKEGGAWPLYGQNCAQHECETSLSTWHSWAIRLWADYFSCVDKK